MLTNDKIRQKILGVVKDEIDKIKRSSLPGNLQTGGILRRVANELAVSGNTTYEQMILSTFQGLMNTGHFAWGYDLGNPSHPFFHVTSQGIDSLKNFSRDPSNPTEYLRYIDTQCQLNDVERSYLIEAVSTFNSNHYKSAAVMIGATAECLIFRLRDAILLKIASPAKKLTDWQAKTVFNALKLVLDKNVHNMPSSIRDEYNAYWPALNEQIRRTRNDAGHPENISSFTFEDVHASLLMFPNIAKLTNHLLGFIKTNTF